MSAVGAVEVTPDAGALNLPHKMQRLIWQWPIRQSPVVGKVRPEICIKEVAKNYLLTSTFKDTVLVLSVDVLV